MLKPQKTPPSHEDLFIQRYSWLLGWALQLTNQDRHRAENLVHDAFVQFVLSRPEIQRIHNLEAYLYITLKNTYLSQARQAAKDPERQLSLIDYDTAELGLRTTAPFPNLQVQDDLRQICRYACLRKETSKAGSVLIFRFFHGYYPSEITQALKVSGAAVKKLLQMARSEARLYLDHPEALGFIRASATAEAAPINLGRTTDDLLKELKHMIYRSRHGDCLSNQELKRLYYGDEPGASPGAVMDSAPAARLDTIGCEVLAHLVSCPRCLDQVNQLLGLPLLADRDPAETMGNDPGSKGGGGGEAPGAGSRAKVVSRPRVKETFEHYPKELRIVVNGLDLGSQRVNSALIEQNLKLNVGEPISFVEVFSEQGVRMLLLNLDQPPDGPIEQRAQVELSEQRRLALSLSFSTHWPTLSVTYSDPTFGEEETAQLDGEGEGRGEAAASTALLLDAVAQQLPTPDTRQSRFWRRVWGRLAPRPLPQSWFRPGLITAVISVILIASLILIRQPAPPVSAAELLRQSGIVEEADAARTDAVLHRTINLEERAFSAGQAADLANSDGEGTLIARRRIEIWRSAERGLTARRVYNEQEQLIAGEWIRRDGATNDSRTVYRRPKAAADPEIEFRNRPQSQLAAIRNPEVWQLEPSATDFSALIERVDAARVEETPAAYVVSYEGGGATASLIRARLILSKADLHAIEQTLLVRIGGLHPQLREYRYLETSFERRRASAAPAAAFEPEPELTISAGNDLEKEPRGDLVNISPSPHPSIPPSPAVATAELEVETLQCLRQAGADLGEQVSVRRTPEGKLRVEGLLETGQRKEEILRALDRVSRHPAVEVEVMTVAEALQRNPPPPASSSQSMVEKGTTTASAIPVYLELRRYLAGQMAHDPHTADKRAAAKQVDEEVRLFAARMLLRSSQALAHAWAMRRLSERFPPETARALKTEAWTKWMAMIGEHARAIQEETAALRLELQPVFFPAAPTDEAQDEMEIADEADRARSIRRLFELASANDQAIRSAFTISSGTVVISIIKSPQFRRSLNAVERLAAALNKVSK